MSRIDGVSSIEDLAFSCGISIEEVERVLERLVELGAVRWAGSDRWTDQSNRAETHARESQSQDRTSEVADETLTSQVTSPEFERVAELEQEIDLSIDRQKEILEAFYQIDRQSHYQALGVSQKADKREIRAAYFELSKRYHTDSVFGKRLGGFKSKMEAVFKRITEAYEVLGKKKKRRDYDEYLSATAQTQEVEQLLAQTHRQTHSLSDGLTITVTEKGSVKEPALRDSATDVESPISSARPKSRGEQNGLRRFSSRPTLTPQERKSRAEKMLRIRMSTIPDPSSSPPSRLSQSSVPPETPEDGKVRRDSLVKNLASSLDAASKITGGRDKAARFLKEARAAENKGDLVQAANRLQLAVTFAPNREDIKAEYQRVWTLVAADFADKFEKQAIYEEKEGKWRSAAQSWSRVCDGRPTDSHCAIRAAEALLKASGDMRKAHKFAQKAVDIEPNNLSHLLVLARIYLVLGHKLNAKRELERAAKLDPTNKVVKDLLKEVQ